MAPGGRAGTGSVIRLATKTGLLACFPEHTEALA